eukprot:7145951-Prymnesium_polylepis.1
MKIPGCSFSAVQWSRCAASSKTSLLVRPCPDVSSKRMLPNPMVFAWWGVVGRGGRACGWVVWGP